MRARSQRETAEQDVDADALPSVLTTNVHRVGDTPGSVPSVESW